jgi:hypothetical protein
MRKAAITLCGAAVLLAGPASAQFGMVQLPSDDFIWRWADAADEEPRLGPEDFDVRGSELPFQCVLTGALSPGSQITTQELQQMESELQTSLWFIQASAAMMNDLDLNREISWAMLDCKKPQTGDEDPAEVEEKVERARQKAVEDMLRRRERAQQRQ